LLELYDTALPQVYGYLHARCRDTALAEDLTAEVFLAAVGAVRRGGAPPAVGWLIGTARHKLVDHWRREARERGALRLAADELEDSDPWDAELDVLRAREVLGELGPHHRAALTLRYLDGLSIPETAELLGRTRHATEALVVRARAAFRRCYQEGESHV
jgi:RNA polymerase sigma-70 factor (ECF subfamily)